MDGLKAEVVVIVVVVVVGGYLFNYPRIRLALGPRQENGQGWVMILLFCLCKISLTSEKLIYTLINIYIYIYVYIYETNS